MSERKPEAGLGSSLERVLDVFTHAVILTDQRTEGETRDAVIIGAAILTLAAIVDDGMTEMAVVLADRGRSGLAWRES